MPQQSIRFGIHDNKGFTALTWKCWTTVGVGKFDVYLSPRPLGEFLKASMHQSGSWHIGYTDKVEYSHESSEKPSNKYIQIWPKPNEIAPGLILAFRIITPFTAVNSPVDTKDKTSGKIIWVLSAPDGKATEIDIVITNRETKVTNWPGQRSLNTKLIGTLNLDNKQTVWIVYRVIDMPEMSNFQGEPKFFKGKSFEDLQNGTLRALLFNDNSDGSRAIFDCIVKKKKK